MRESWEKEWKDTLVLENDANDFYYEWFALRETRLEDLFKEWLTEGNWETDVMVKVRPGAIFICASKKEEAK